VVSQEYKKITALSNKFAEFLKELGLDLANDSLKDTPKRVARMFYNELFEGLYKPEPRIRLFENHNNYDQIITNSATIFSTCEHHFVPIKMKVHIGYIPNGKICGISKLIRIAEWFAHRPQVQEKLTQQIADFLNEKLNPQGVMVVIEGEHFCEQMRGIKKIDSVMRTSAFKGCFEELAVRNEFFKLIGGL